MLTGILLAFMFLTMSALQPGPFGSQNGALFHDGGGAVAERQQVASDVAPASIDPERPHADVSTKTGKVTDKNCGIHCAPMAALLVDYPTIQAENGGRLVPPSTLQLPSAEYGSPIRPPRLVA